MARRDLTSETAEDKFDVEAEARRRGIQAYQVRAMQAVPDRLVKDIVADAYRGISQSASMIPDRQRSEPLPKGNGWVDPAPLTPPSGIDIIDRMVEAQDRADRAVRAQQEMELAEIERRLDRRNPHRAKTEYDHLKRYDDDVPPAHREKP